MVSADPCVIDASATVEYLLESELGQQVANMIDGVRLLAPEMLDAEVLSALRQRVQGERITEEAALRALDKLAAWPLERISHRNLTHAAWELRHNVSAYDALYVVLAQTHGATLITVDGRLARAPASVLGITLINVSDG